MNVAGICGQISFLIVIPFLLQSWEWGSEGRHFAIQLQVRWLTDVSFDSPEEGQSRRQVWIHLWAQEWRQGHSTSHLCRRPLSNRQACSLGTSQYTLKLPQKEGWGAVGVQSQYLTSQEHYSFSFAEKWVRQNEKKSWMGLRAKVLLLETQDLRNRKAPQRRCLYLVLFK